MISAKQKGVAKGMASAMLCCLLLFYTALRFIPSPNMVNSLEARLNYIIPWFLLPALAVLLGVAYIASYRFFNERVIDGENPADEIKLVAARSYLQNTVEQVVLATIVYLSLAILLPVNWLQLIPTLTIWFFFCRLLFAFTYKRGAPARSFGFAGTFYSTAIGFCLAIWFALFG